MTAQEVLNKVWAHLRAQGQRSMNAEGCVYRGPAGLMCAVGCLIPDDKYTLKMEGYDAAHLVRRDMPELKVHQDLLMRLQHVHDNCHPDYWEEELADVARIFGLEVLP